jgi:glycosyltransferase involved in cell wall biosynthesis
MSQAGPDGRPHVVVLHESSRTDWRWIAHHLPEMDWTFVRAPASTSRLTNRVAILAAALRAATRARKADLFVSMGPGLGSAGEIARRFGRVRTPHICYYLNFPHLPLGARRARQSRTYRTIDRIVVSSSIERDVYARHFALDAARIDVVLWGTNPPEVADQGPGGPPYVCAVGGNARDYALLMQVAAARPAMRFIIVVRPANLQGLTIPANVEVRVNIPFPGAMAIVRDARIMALPLLATDTPCGHVTIVAAHYLGTPVVVTDSAGVADYVGHDETGLVTQTGSAAALGAAIDQLWNDPSQARRIGEAGRAFARAACSEHNYVEHIRAMVDAPMEGRTRATGR